MAGLQDLLSWMDNKRRVVGRNLSDLVNDPANYLEKTADNTLQTVRELPDDPANFLGGGVGHIAYHGSPHKFDKFSLDKIGTGEGAQAYGHGLYLAESPEVANAYKNELSKSDFKFKSGLPNPRNYPGWAWQDLPTVQRVGDAIKRGRDPMEYISDYKQSLAEKFDGGGFNHELIKKNLTTLEKLEKQLSTGSAKYVDNGQLYKTDIPDEAVARFLDWDKPLSQQSKEVQAVARQKLARQIESASKPAVPGDGWGDLSAPYDVLSEMTGKDLVFNLRPNNNVSLQNLTGGGGPEVSDALRKAGIPGIRYLDGGSRSAGQGSSNFVAFDPEMIRILERNGQPTGLKPWNPGEYRPLNDLMNVRTD